MGKIMEGRDETPRPSDQESEGADRPNVCSKQFVVQGTGSFKPPEEQKTKAIRS